MKVVMFGQLADAVSTVKAAGNTMSLSEDTEANFKDLDCFVFSSRS